jgi:hypothetical protein
MVLGETGDALCFGSCRTSSPPIDPDPSEQNAGVLRYAQNDRLINWQSPLQFSKSQSRLGGWLLVAVVEKVMWGVTWVSSGMKPRTT